MFGSFPPSRTFWLFLAQVLDQDGSCREALRRFLAWLAVAEGKSASPNTAAYCKARKRLSLEEIESVRKRVARQLERSAEGRYLWYGRPVKVFDGTAVSMPDTPENQARYPQPNTQKPGCGFPVMHIVAVFSLASGVLLDIAKGALYADHERTLFRQLWHILKARDVVLADCGFCSYADFYLLGLRHIDCVMRNHQKRKVGLREIKRLGKGDRLVNWVKMIPCPKWLSKEQWAAIPATMTVREITFTIDIPGFRSETITLATTLLDHRQFPKQAFTDLYLKRWEVELNFRHIKTTMGMDILRCKTPEMVEKELSMHLIAYNLVRAIMLDAAHKHHTPIERLSVKGTIATIRQWAPALTTAQTDTSHDQLYRQMILYIAQDKLPHRPNRTEPRARKRRAKNYQLLNKPRHQFKEIQHRNKYSKTKS